MRKKWIFIAPAAIVGLALFIFLGGELVMHLWNWLLPALFGWRTVSFWQALGLLALCRILFGGFSSGHRGPNRRWRKNRWQKMTPEQRERFRERLESCWGGDFGAAPGDTKQPA